MDSNNRDIFKDLLTSTKPTRADLERLVEKSKRFLKLDEFGGKVIVETQFPFTVTEKIILFLVGTFLAREANLRKNTKAAGSEISKGIEVAHTTISGPLRELVRREKVIDYDKKEGAYSIRYNKIDEVLDKLGRKYGAPELPGKIEVKTKVRKKTRSIKKKSTKKDDFVTEKAVDIEASLKKYNLEKDQFDSIFSVDNDTILIKEDFATPDASLKEQHVRGALLLLAAYKIYFDKEEVESTLLRDSLKHSGLTSLVSLSTSLKKVRALVLHMRGKKGSTKTSYRAFPKGINAGVTIIKDILNGTKKFSVDFKKQIKLRKAPTIAIGAAILDKEVKKLAKRRDLNLEKLKSSFDFQPDHLALLQDVPGANRKEKQLKALLLLGYILSEVYSLESFNGKELLDKSYIVSNRLDLLNSNKYYKYYFISNRSKLNMGLTYKGKVEALSMLREFLSKGDCVLK